MVTERLGVFTLNSRGEEDGEKERDELKKGVWSVLVKQPQLQIGRAYTPLPPTTTNTTNTSPPAISTSTLRLLIRREPGGEVSSYLHSLPTNSTIELRGPNTECEIPDNVKEVVFLAGGTGIAPAMQVADLFSRRGKGKMRILWACRSRDECAGGVGEEQDGGREKATGGWGWAKWWRGGQRKENVEVQAPASQTSETSIQPGPMVSELQALQQRCPDLKISYFVDEERSFIKPAIVSRYLTALPPTPLISVGEIETGVRNEMEKDTDKIEGKGKRLILVSGPDGFIEYWAGKKEWVDGQERQGRLGGVLGGMLREDLKRGGWSVVKL